MSRAPMSPQQITTQANQIGRPYGVYCVYVPEKEGFAWVFYRRTAFKSVRLGATHNPRAVIERMEHYITTDKARK